MAIQQKMTVRVSGVDQNGTAATASFTSDAIPFNQNIVWSLNVWFASLVVSGANPKITIEVSDVTDPNSFNALDTATNITVPHYFDNLDSTWKYMRIVYAANGVTGGTKNFNLIQFV